ncbi:hypothetical protein ABNE68_17145, partial [Paenibacillus larvae]
MTKWRLTLVDGSVIVLNLGGNRDRETLESLKQPGNSKWVIADEVAINYDHVMLIEFIKSEEE